MNMISLSILYVTRERAPLTGGLVHIYSDSFLRDQIKFRPCFPRCKLHVKFHLRTFSSAFWPYVSFRTKTDVTFVYLSIFHVEMIG